MTGLFDKKLDLDDSFKCLMAMREERYYAERFVVLWHFLGQMLFPKDVEAQRILRLLAASRLYLYLKDDGCALESPARESAIATLTEHELPAEQLIDCVFRLVRSDFFTSHLIGRFDECARATQITDALFQLESLKEEKRQRRPSLAKAIHFIEKGGFGKTSQRSKTTLKQEWRDWATSLPVISAAWDSQWNFFGLIPLHEQALENFLLVLRDDPKFFEDWLSRCRSIQERMLSLIDKSSKKKAFLRYPDFVPIKQMKFKVMPHKRRDIAKGYWKNIDRGSEIRRPSQV